MMAMKIFEHSDGAVQIVVNGWKEIVVLLVVSGGSVEADGTEAMTVRILKVYIGYSGSIFDVSVFRIEIEYGMESGVEW